METENFDGTLIDHISNFIGETVTIYTTSGGQSGFGFTGVVISVNPCFVRLITRIGPPPGCALGSSCRCARNLGRGERGGFSGGFGVGMFNSLGSVVDIPVDRIASFVHNAV